VVLTSMLRSRDTSTPGSLVQDLNEFGSNFSRRPVRSSGPGSPGPPIQGRVAVDPNQTSRTRPHSGCPCRAAIADSMGLDISHYRTIPTARPGSAGLGQSASGVPALVPIDELGRRRDTGFEFTSGVSRFRWRSPYKWISVTLKQYQDGVDDIGYLPGGPSPAGAPFNGGQDR